MKSQRGFTLVEMMVVVAIIAILAGLMIGVSSRTYGASAQNVADQINQTITFTRTRSISTRRYHYVEVQPNQIQVWQWGSYGMSTPVPSTCPACWQLVQQVKIPGGVLVWNAETTVHTTTGTTPSQDTSLDTGQTGISAFYFKPDGSSTGGTIFVTDTQQSKKYRVLIYPVTGSSYAREGW